MVDETKSILSISEEMNSSRIPPSKLNLSSNTGLNFKSNITNISKHTADENLNSIYKKSPYENLTANDQFNGATGMSQFKAQDSINMKSEESNGGKLTKRQLMIANLQMRKARGSSQLNGLEIKKECTEIAPDVRLIVYSYLGP